jgi:hypothetical protein
VAATIINSHCLHTKSCGFSEQYRMVIDRVRLLAIKFIKRWHSKGCSVRGGFWTSQTHDDLARGIAK